MKYSELIMLYIKGILRSWMLWEKQDGGFASFSHLMTFKSRKIRKHVKTVTDVISVNCFVYNWNERGITIYDVYASQLRAYFNNNKKRKVWHNLTFFHKFRNRFMLCVIIRSLYLNLMAKFHDFKFWRYRKCVQTGRSAKVACQNLSL